MREHPPRHIRDIAHLYLSRMHRADGGGTRIAFSGMDAGAFSGFHVASLAVAAASRGHVVHVDERSGLAANVGCFLALSPECWVMTGDRRPAPVTALASVTLAVSAPADSPPSPSPERAGEAQVEFVHLPPFDARGAFEAALQHTAQPGKPTLLVYLSRVCGDGPSPWLAGGPPATRVVFLSRKSHAPRPEACVGHLSRWQSALADPVAACLRDSRSRLARDYARLAEALLVEFHAEYPGESPRDSSAESHGGASADAVRRAIPPSLRTTRRAPAPDPR